jgi:hypothetical protein
MQILQKGKKNLVCVLSPHVDIAIEKEKSNVGFEPHVGIIIEEVKPSVGIVKEK